MRVSLIVFGLQDGQVKGFHWISYSRKLENHRRIKSFSEESIAWKVASEAENSPKFISNENANNKGDDRGNRPYRSYYLFQVNEYSVEI